MMLPDELEWVLEMLGYNWPTADEDKLKDCAKLWRKFGDDVTELHTKANTSARQVVAHNAGESIDAFTKTYAKFDGGGGGGYLQNAAQAAYIIATVLEACAYLVEFAKWAVIAQLIALAIEIAAAQAAAPFTFGLSEVGALGATQAARLIVRRLLKELKDALLEAIVEAMKEPAISMIEAIITDLIRQTVNVGFGAQEGYDLATTAKQGAGAGWDAIKQTPQTLAEGVRDSLGEKAGHRAHHAIDSRIDGHGGGSEGGHGDGDSNSSDADGDSNSSGGDGSSNGADSSVGEGGSNSSSDSSSSGSDSNGSHSSGPDSSTSTRLGGDVGTNIGGGISADTGGNGIGGPDLGAGPGSDSGPDSGSGTDSGTGSDSGTPRPTLSHSGPTLSDFDDPSPDGASPGGADSGGASDGPGASGPSHSGGGSSVSGLSSPTVHSVAASASSGGMPPSTSTGGHGGISTNIDSLAASTPTHTTATPTAAPTTSDPSPNGGGPGRADGGSGIPTSPVAPATAGGVGGGSHHGAAAGSSAPSGASPSSSAPNSVTANTTSATGSGTTASASASATTDGRVSGGAGLRVSGTGDGRIPGTTDGRTPGTPDGRTPTQRTPGSTTPGDGTTPRNTPGTRPGDGTTPRTPTDTRPGDGTTPRTTPGTRPGDGTTPRTSADPTGSTRPSTTGPAGSTRTNTTDPTSDARSNATGQSSNPSTATQNPAQSSSSRTTSPSTGTSTTTPSTSTGSGSDRTSTPGNGTSGSSAPSGRTPNSSNRPGPADTPGTPGGTSSTPGSQNRPGTGADPTPNRPPQQPAGSPPGSPPQPTAQPNNPQQHQQQVTPIPVHTVVRTPAAPAAPSHTGLATPQAPGSPQATPGDAGNQQHPQQDSLQDIRSDLDHHPGGLTEPDPADQQALVDAVPHNEDGTPQRFPDPFEGNWSQLQNDGGVNVPGRSNNCADCSRSFLETWYGNPQVSAPRTLDTDANGKPDHWSPEDDANENQIRWTGAAHTYAGPGGDPATADNIANTLQQAGPGSAAIVQVDWPGGGGHAFNVVNHNGNIVWVDTQSGQVSSQPLHIDQAAHVWHIPLDADRNPIDTGQPQTNGTESQSGESQNENGDGSQPDNAQNDGQQENGQAPQNEVSADPPKQHDDTDTGTDAPAAADQDSSADADPAQPSTADPNTSSPDPANSEPGDENGRPRSETPSTPDQQAHPSEVAHPDERDHTLRKDEEQPTATTEAPSRPDPSPEQRPPAHATSDATDNGTPDKTSTPARTETDTPTDPTTDRHTPQQTTAPSDPRTTDPRAADPRAQDPRASDPHSPDPRAHDPRTSDPRTSDPRTSDPRTSDPRVQDPRTSDPQTHTPPRKSPETDERSDGRRADNEPMPDREHPDHAEDPRPAAPDADRPDSSDHTRPESPDQSPADDHRDHPGNMTKDSAVPQRESPPDGRNADAAHYVKDSVNGKKPLYGDIAAEQSAQPPRPAHPEHPSGPAEPAGDGSGDPDQRRQRDLDMLARANSNDPKDRAWFEKYYHPRSGYRRSVTAPAEDGRPVPQLHPTNDPNAPWMLANDAPEADPESYIDEGAGSGERHTEISDDNLKRLDRAAKERQDAIDADNQPHKDRKAAKDAYEANKTPENLKKFEEADARHSPLHGKMTRASEDYGEAVAEHHVMPRHFPDYDRVDDRAMGNNRFDQIYRDPNTDPPHFVVVEAKGSLTADLGERRGLAPETGSDQSVSPDDPGQNQGDGARNDDGQDSQNAPGPGVPRVRQGTRAYFETILHEMDARARRNLDTARTDADLDAASAERQLARDLRKALEADPSRVKYILVKGNSSGGKHQGYEMKQFDIRTEEEKARDADSAT
ncbi:toxin glutamine deamidase domain-containing protein [Streptomyces sp. NPDC002092]